jgi:hypothetical protein
MYQSKHFDQCVFNPLANGRMIEVYPKLAGIIELDWAADPDIDNILRYISALYDPKSPLLQDEKDLNYRMGIAAEIACFNMEDEELLRAIYTHTHNFSPELITRFLMRFIRSKEWAAICAFEYAYWESLRKVMEPITGKNSKEELDAVQKKSAVKDEIEKDIRRLEMLYKAFFGGDELLEKKVKRRITPEEIAAESKKP